MQRQNVRVILASEHPEVRHFLREVVEEESGAVILGQAENATKALALAKHLRPDVAIIDCYLPHTMGSDTVPLSRVGGLDVAESISEEIPDTKVVLLNIRLLYKICAMRRGNRMLSFSLMLRRSKEQLSGGICYSAVLEFQAD
jgi:CheY-like chemotaxis protein